MDLNLALKTAKDSESSPEQLDALLEHGEEVDRLLARHPKASADLLEGLSHSSDRSTRRYVVGNPNATKEVLVKLAPQFPGDFFKNPAFDWLLLEQPNLMFEIGGGVLKNVLKRPECPASFMNWAAAHGSEQERLAVAMNPSASVDALLAIERKGGKAEQAARQHANHPDARGEDDLEAAFRGAVAQAIAESFRADDLPTLAQWPALSDVGRLQSAGFWEHHFEYATHPLAPSALVGSMLTLHPASKFAGNPATSIEVLTVLAGHSWAYVRGVVAGNPAAPVDILTALASDSDVDVRRAVAKNPAAPAEILTVLAGDSDLDVRRRVAQNSATPIDILTAFANDSDLVVRSVVAQNSDTPVEIRLGLLTALASDSDVGVRRLVAQNAATPAEILTGLASDSDLDVRSKVAKNSATPVDILTALASDSNPHVRGAVAENVATPPGVLTALASYSGYYVQGPVESIDIHIMLLASKYVHMRVARNSATPIDIQIRLLTMLAGSTDVRVRGEVANNPTTPVNILITLAGSTDVRVRGEVANNPTTPVNILIELASDSHFEVRSYVAKNPTTPPGILTTLADDPDSYVRHAVAFNPKAPDDVVRKLIEAFCQQADQLVVDARRSAWWVSEVAKLKSRDVELITACKTGDILFLPDKVAEKACRKTTLAWRLLGLSHRLAPIEVLAKCSRSTEWAERMAVARNTNTPRKVIEALRRDPNRLVARQAEATARLS